MQSLNHAPVRILLTRTPGASGILIVFLMLLRGYPGMTMHRNRHTGSNLRERVSNWRVHICTYFLLATSLSHRD